MRGIIGKKLDMTQIYGVDGSVVPVTAVQAGPCTVVQVKTVERDGYSAVQLGFGEKKNIKKPLVGHIKGAYTGKENRGFLTLKEIRMDSTEGAVRGNSIDATVFSKGEMVDVIGFSKGKGFAGVVKRHHFHGHPTSHGHKDQERMPGSIGSGGNQRVFKGLRMAGRMGNDRVTVKNLKIVDIDEEKGLLYVKGAVPGARNGLLLIQTQGEMKWTKPAEKPTEQEVAGETTQE